MNHVYFTALINGAGLAAEIAAELDAGLSDDVFQFPGKLREFMK
ncbi:hypothetical protein FHU42_002005 [Corynebacterium glutamicum]|nr:hypothetical protein [Corynebacterium glutamicum]